MRSIRLPLLVLCVTLFGAFPLCAQFNLVVQVNGQVSGVSNGGTISLNAPAIGQSVTAAVTVTYIGSGTVTFAPGQIIGPANFTTGKSAGVQTLNTFQSTVVDFVYTASGASTLSAEFAWPYTQTVSAQSSSTGEVILNLLGNAPNPIVTEISNGNDTVIPDGGTIQFPTTILNSASSATVSIGNSGSGPATINSVAATGAGYSLQGLPLFPLSINPGSQLTFTIQFLPVASGASQGSLRINYAGGSTSVVLSGSGLSSFLSYTVTQAGQTSPLAANQTITLGNAAVGSSSSAIVQFQNVNNVPLVLSSFSISGTGFTLTDVPFLPLTLQPQQSASVTVSFAASQPGQFSGRLLIGQDTFLLSGGALGSLLQFSSSAGAISSGGTITFPLLALGQSESTQFTILNAGTAPAFIPNINLTNTGNGFTLSALPGLPLQLAPNASATITIGFSPVSSGQSTTTLSIGTQSFALSGFASSPPLPAIQFTGASGVQQPFQQPSVGLSLSSPYPVDLNGTLTLAVLTTNFATDPAIQFSSGGQKVAFTIPANTLQAVFPSGGTQISLQSGTVASEIVITAAFTVGTPATAVYPPDSSSIQLTIPSLAPVLLTTSISTRTTTSITFQVSGYVTSRTLSQLTFQLQPAAGVNIGSATASVDVSNAAQTWFQGAASQSTGGQFTVQVPFTFAGAVSAGTDLTKNLSAVAITATNSIGTSNSLTLPIP